MKDKIVIRPATKNDLSGIYALVKELAIYEKEPEAVTATLEDYYQDFEAGVFESDVAIFEDEIIGATVFYMAYSTWKGKMLYLEDFVVTESYRKYGIGQLLFDQFIQNAIQKKCVLTKWQVLDWNEPALKFYHKNEAIIEKEWWNGKLFLPKE